MAAAGNTTCVFCEIVAGRAPAERIAENDQALAVLDIQPFAAGHTLVLSKRHVRWWHDLTPEEAAGVFGLAHQVANRLREAFEPEFVGMYARGRRIPHTHIFLVPSSRGDVLDRFFDGLQKVQEGSDDLSALRSNSARKKTAKRIKGV